MGAAHGFGPLFEMASEIQKEIDTAGLGQAPAPLVGDATRTPLDLFDELISSEALGAASRPLFAGQHYARAVEEAFKCLNNSVKEKSGLHDLDGDALMRRAFSAENPALKLNRLRSISQKDEQRGYMEIYAGVMKGIRNPRAHEHLLQDQAVPALELLVMANHMMGN